MTVLGIMHVYWDKDLQKLQSKTYIELTNKQKTDAYAVTQLMRSWWSHFKETTNDFNSKQYRVT